MRQEDNHAHIAILAGTRLRGRCSSGPDCGKGRASPTSHTCWPSPLWRSKTAATEDEAIAALLHDTVEDCGGEARLRDVRERFGATVADIVWGCSDTLETPKPPWRERKEAYLHRLDAESPSVLLVSACDKLHNVRSLLVSVRNDGEAAWARFKGGKEGTLWYYRAALATLKRLGVSPRLAHELEISLEELHRAVDSKVPLSDVHFPDA